MTDSELKEFAEECKPVYEFLAKHENPDEMVQVRATMFQDVVELSDGVLALLARIERLKETVRSVLWVDECRCGLPWTMRKMHEPNALCGELDPLREALADDDRSGGKQG